jgi:MFS family permease
MRSVLYLLVFLVTLHGTLIIYGNSSYLEGFLSPSMVGVAYMASAAMVIASVLSLRPLLRRYGAFPVTLVTMCIELWALIGLSRATSAGEAVALFVISQAAIGVLYVCFDVFLERVTRNADTGGIRGVFLTSVNLAFLVGPGVAGIIIDSLSFPHVYLASALLLIPAIILAVGFLGKFKDAHYQQASLLLAVRRARRSADISSGMAVYLLLWIFYVLAIVYVPLYLSSTLDYSFAQIGALLAFILVPFVIFQIPLGRIADKWLGEQELLVAGFGLMALTSFLVPFLAPLGFWWLAITLFVGRIGACAVEVMSDTYFFKHVASRDIDMITLYRTMMNVAYIVTPILAVPFFMLIGPSAVFFLSGAFAAIGIVPSLVLKDTK